MTTQDDINSFGPTSSAACLVKLAAQTRSETTNRVVSVATVNNLPDLTCNTITPGTVLFVESILAPVVAQVGCWTGLDNREVRSDFCIGLVSTWGINDTGQLGDSSSASICRSSPAAVVGGFIDWNVASAGQNHNVAVRTNGTAWSWGDGSFGVLGNNSVFVPFSSPVSVVGGFTDWCAVSSGSCHNAAIRTNATAWSWGLNFYGQLGDYSTTNRSSPVSVVGGFTDWSAVSAGVAHTLALRANGTAWAWGRGTDGRLGNNNTATLASSPVSVVGGLTDWCRISAGGYHSLAVRTNGTAWSWGKNSIGALGDNTTTSRSSPVSVVGGFTDWCAVSAGLDHSLGVTTNGSAWAWGAGGRLGDNTNSNQSSPVSVVGGFTDWCALGAGTFHSAAVRTNGTAWAWGSNSKGQLGDNSTLTRSSPVSVVGGFTNWVSASAGRYHTVAVRKF